MKINQFIILIVILFISSCIQDETKELGSCYIIENETIKYLDLKVTGDIDTIELEYANAENFEVINDSMLNLECLRSDVWSKDKLSVWYKQYKIIGADPFTFNVLEDSYSKDKQYVFYKNLLLINANQANFEILTNFFAKDKERIWYKGNEVFGIDKPTDFKVIDGYFSTDGNSIFFNNDTLLLRVPDSDVNTFTGFNNNMHLSSLKYYKDKNNIYCLDTESNIGETDFMYVFDAFTESFEILNEKYYSKDNFNVYYKNKVVENADRHTFESIGNNYSRDSINIFFRNKIINGVDYNNFKLSESDTTDATDSVNFYFKGKIVN